MDFVVGTGRCGTMTITELLNRCPQIKAEHEPEPRLIREGTEYLSGKLTHPDAMEAFAPFDTWDINVVVNHKISTMLPVVKDVFPEAKIIWLIRDVRTFISSVMARNWYIPGKDKGLYGAFRLPAPDYITDPVAKCAWYWQYFNWRIQRDMGDLPYMMVKMEEINERSGEIFDFLDYERPLDLTTRTLNATGNKSKLVPWTQWSVEQFFEVDNHAGDIMEEHYGENWFYTPV